MSRSAFLPWLLFASGCNGIWGLDEVTLDEGASSASASSTASGSSSTSSSSGAGGEDCARCGCPSELIAGDFEVPSEVEDLEFEQCDAAFLEDPETGCGLLTVTNGIQYCTYRQLTETQPEVGGMCVVGRVRARAASSSANIFIEIQQPNGEPSAVIMSRDLDDSFTERPIGCRLPAQFQLNELYFSVNRGGDDQDFAIDFIEAEIVDCADAPDDADSPCGED